MGVDESPAVPPPWWVLKARERIIRRWRRIYPAKLYPRKRCPLLRDLPDDRLRDLDNELQQKVAAFQAQKSTSPPPPREEFRPDRQLRTPSRGTRTVFLAQKSRPDRQPCTPPRETRRVDDDDKSLSDDDDGEPPPALDALPAQPDDVDNEPTDDAAAADPDGVPLSPTSELEGLLARDGVISRDAQGLETELASRSQMQILRDAPPPVSSMPDMNPRPSGGASLDNTAPPPAHSAALPTGLLPSSNKPMGRTTEDSARAPQKEKPRCALESHKDMALGSESPTPACKIWSPKSCVSCGNRIPAGQ